MYILENIFNNGFKQNGLILVSILSIISGILVIISRNPVRSVLFLIGLFLTITIYLFMLNISFIALAYLLVYVGAVSILFLFILMLINIRVSELTTDNSNSVPLSVIIITIFTVAFSGRLLLYKSSNNMVFLSNTYLNDNERIELLTKDNFLTSESFFTNLTTVKDTNEQVSMGFSCIWENVLADMSHITSIGNVLYVSYTIGILIVGLILLLSMIGAISVTSTNKN